MFIHRKFRASYIMIFWLSELQSDQNYLSGRIKVKNKTGFKLMNYTIFRYDATERLISDFSMSQEGLVKRIHRYGRD